MPAANGWSKADMLRLDRYFSLLLFAKLAELADFLLGQAHTGMLGLQLHSYNTYTFNLHNRQLTLSDLIY